MTATACTANASLISNRSTSSSVQPVFVEHRPHRRRRASSSPTSARGRWSPAPTMRASGVRPRAARVGGRHHDERRGAVVDARRVAGGDGAVGLERRLQRAERLAASCPRAPTRRDRRRRRSPFFCGIVHRQDLVGERAGVAAPRPPSGGSRPRRRPARCARDAVLLGDGLAGHAHVPVLEGAPQAVVDHRSRRSAPLPMRSPSRARGSRYGRAGSSTPCRRRRRCRCRRPRSPCAASITAFRPEPQTLLIVSADTADRQAAAERRLARRVLAERRPRRRCP